MPQSQLDTLVLLKCEFPKLRPIMDAAKNRRAIIRRVDADIWAEAHGPLLDEINLTEGDPFFLKTGPGPPG